MDKCMYIKLHLDFNIWPPSTELMQKTNKFKIHLFPFQSQQIFQYLKTVQPLYIVLLDLQNIWKMESSKNKIKKNLFFVLAHSAPTDELTSQLYTRHHYTLTVWSTKFLMDIHTFHYNLSFPICAKISKVDQGGEISRTKFSGKTHTASVQRKVLKCDENNLKVADKRHRGTM